MNGDAIQKETKKISFFDSLLFYLCEKKLPLMKRKFIQPKVSKPKKPIKRQRRKPKNNVPFLPCHDDCFCAHAAKRAEEYDRIDVKEWQSHVIRRAVDECNSNTRSRKRYLYRHWCLESVKRAFELYSISFIVEDLIERGAGLDYPDEDKRLECHDRCYCKSDLSMLSDRQNCCVDRAKYKLCKRSAGYFWDTATCKNSAMIELILSRGGDIEYAFLTDLTIDYGLHANVFIAWFPDQMTLDDMIKFRIDAAKRVVRCYENAMEKDLPPELIELVIEYLMEYYEENRDEIQSV